MPPAPILTFRFQTSTTAEAAGPVGVIMANADLRVGAVAETVTVDGAPPVVDVQSVRREVALT